MLSLVPGSVFFYSTVFAYDLWILGVRCVFLFAHWDRVRVYGTLIRPFLYRSHCINLSRIIVWLRVSAPLYRQMMRHEMQFSFEQIHGGAQDAMIRHGGLFFLALNACTPLNTIVKKTTYRTMILRRHRVNNYLMTNTLWLYCLLFLASNWLFISNSNGWGFSRLFVVHWCYFNFLTSRY